MKAHKLVALVLAFMFTAVFNFGVIAKSVLAAGSGTIVLQATTVTVASGCNNDPICILNDVIVDGEVVGSIKFIQTEPLTCHPAPANCETIAQANYSETVIITLDGYGTFTGTEIGSAYPISNEVGVFNSHTTTNIVSSDGCYVMRSRITHGSVVIETNWTQDVEIFTIQPTGSC